MKKVLIFGILLSILATIFNACGKEDNPTPPDLRFPLPLLTKDTTGDTTISGRDPGSFIGKIVVDLYYGTDVKPQKVDVVVIKNDNRANVKTIKADVTSFPASIQVTGTQLTTLFDSIKLGDRFEIGVDVTTIKGQKFEAFPVTGNPYGADTATLPGSRFSIIYVADCLFSTTYFNGYYTVLTNTWDYQAGDSVEVRPGVGNKILISAWPNPEFGSYIRFPMTVEVDPVTYEATVPLQGVGDYAGGPSHIIDSGTGTVSPCGDKITLSVTMSVGTFFGDMPLVLGK